MMRRPTLVAASLLLTFTSTAFATDPVIQVEEKVEGQESPSLSDTLRITFDYSPPEFTSFADSVTMTHLPSGSLYTRYEGLHGVIVKQIRSQFRSFTRRAIKNGWYVLPDRYDSSRREFYQRLDHLEPDPRSNGSMWNRNWWEFLPPEKGGAPAEPYIHTYGEEISWRYGPFTVTNTLKLRFDYLAFFELNPDPESPEHGEKRNRLTLDLRTSESASFGTSFKFNVKPRISMGIPRGGDWHSALRGAALQFSFELKHWHIKILEGEAEIRWRPKDGFVFALEVSLASW